MILKLFWEKISASTKSIVRKKLTLYDVNRTKKTNIFKEV